MKGKSLELLFLLLAISGLALTGCVTQPPPVSVSDQYVPAPAAVKEEQAETKKAAGQPDIDYINQRLASYENRFSQWKDIEQRIIAQNLAKKRPARWQECGTSLDAIVNGYGKMRDKYMQEKVPGGDKKRIVVDPWEVQRLDIGYVESGCDAVIKSGAALTGGVQPALPESVEDLIRRYAAEGKYEQAIETYRDLLVKFPKRAEDIQIKQVYGMALLRTSKVEAAAQILPQTLGPLQRNDPQSWSQHRLVADLYFATGQVEKAWKEYQQLADFFSGNAGGNESWNGEDLWVQDQLKLFSQTDRTVGEQGLTIFMSVMRSYITFDGRHMPETMTKEVERLERIFPDSKYTHRARQIVWKAEEQMQIWIKSQLQVVDNHVEAKEYDAALEILDGLLAGSLPEQIWHQVRKAKDDVILAKARSVETQRIIDEQSLDVQWDEAVNFFELRRYDEAITSFSLLLGTEYDARARQKIDESADLAAKILRRQAAATFVEARRSESLEGKKELLVESWRQLKEISDKYPMSSIIGKVRQNMQVIEGEIRQIDPSLLHTLDRRDEPEAESAPKADKVDAGVVVEETL